MVSMFLLPLAALHSDDIGDNPGSDTALQREQQALDLAALRLIYGSEPRFIVRMEFRDRRFRLPVRSFIRGISIQDKRTYD